MTLEDFRQARSEAKHAAILEAALKRFRADGYAGAVMEAIAREAQVSTATLYRHFASKADLFEAVAVSSLDALETQLPDAISDPAEFLSALAQAYGTMLNDPVTRSIVRMHVAEAGRNTELAERFYTAIKARISDAFASGVRAGVDAGLYRPDAEPGQLQGMIEHGTLMRGLILGDDATPVAPVKDICNSALATWRARWVVETNK